MLRNLFLHLFNTDKCGVFINSLIYAQLLRKEICVIECSVFILTRMPAILFPPIFGIEIILLPQILYMAHNTVGVPA